MQHALLSCVHTNAKQFGRARPESRKAMTENDELFDPVTAAAFLRVSKGQMATWRYLGEGPRYSKLGRSIVYKKSALIAFVDASERQGTGDSFASSLQGVA